MTPKERDSSHVSSFVRKTRIKFMVKCRQMKLFGSRNCWPWPGWFCLFKYSRGQKNWTFLLRGCFYPFQVMELFACHGEGRTVETPRWLNISCSSHITVSHNTSLHIRVPRRLGVYRENQRVSTV